MKFMNISSFLNCELRPTEFLREKGSSRAIALFVAQSQAIKAYLI